MGTYIFRGIALSDPRLILLGSVPAAGLALLVDAALGELEHRLDPARPRRAPLRAGLALAAVAGLLGFAAWGAAVEWGERLRGGGPVLRVGSKDATEPILLGHMLADLVEAETGRPVDRAGLNLAGSMVCYNALKSGGIDVYVEYTGTALTTLLGQPPVRDPAEARRRVAAGLARDGVAMLGPLGFENTFALVLRRQAAEARGVRRISDLAGVAGRLRAGFGPEFMNRPDGYPGLVRAYGLRFAEAPREMDRNLLAQAVARGTLDVAAADSTDGRVAALDLVALEDDRRYFPPYEAVPLVRAADRAGRPEVYHALDRLAGRLDAATMRRLNAAVDLEKRDPRSVARAFLLEAGLIRTRPESSD